MVTKAFSWPVNEITRDYPAGIEPEHSAHERRWFIQGAMDALDGKSGSTESRPSVGMDQQAWEAYRLGFAAGQRYKGHKSRRS